MNYDLFENNEEKQDAQAALKGFTDTKGWGLIEKALDANIRYLEDQLKDNLRERSFSSLEEANSLQNRIDDLLSLKDLPNQILLEAKIDEDTPEEEQIFDIPATEAGT